MSSLNKFAHSTDSPEPENHTKTVKITQGFQRQADDINDKHNTIIQNYCKGLSLKNTFFFDLFLNKLAITG